jgi:hypothetical protein
MRYRGIDYKGQRVINSAVTKAKWDGGPVGGIIFELKVGGWGVSGLCWDTFEEAADAVRASYAKSYQRAKQTVDAYEEQLRLADCVKQADLQDE